MEKGPERGGEMEQERQKREQEMGEKKRGND